MEKDEVIHVRLSAEMKKAFTEHAKQFYQLPASQVIRFLIANELSEEGIRLQHPWLTISPNPRTLQTTPPPLGGKVAGVGSGGDFIRTKSEQKRKGR